MEITKLFRGDRSIRGFSPGGFDRRRKLRAIRRRRGTVIGSPARRRSTVMDNPLRVALRAKRRLLVFLAAAAVLSASLQAPAPAAATDPSSGTTPAPAPVVPDSPEARAKA